MPETPGETPKIIIDSDWKAQAQKEREKLTQQEQAAAAKKPAAKAPAPGGANLGPESMPPADFQALVGTLITQALMYMGGFPDPQTGRAMVSLEYAKFHIDLLAVLEVKSKGNLTAEESEDLNQALRELRIRFVEIVKAVEQASKEGRLSQSAGRGMGDPNALGPIGGAGMGGMVGPGL